MDLEQTKDLLTHLHALGVQEFRLLDGGRFEVSFQMRLDDGATPGVDAAVLGDLAKAEAQFNREGGTDETWSS